MIGDPALRVEGLTKAFGGLCAVDKVELCVAAGERRALIGPNGAGKTTLFNLIAGDLPATAGRITVFGRDVTRMPPHRRAALGLARTCQVNDLFPTLTVFENMMLAMHGLSSSKLMPLKSIRAYPEHCARAREVLASVGLAGSEDAVVRTLSHGVQRQLEIAMALSGRPRLLLLDEPAAGLSPAEAQHMVSLLQTLDPAMSVVMIEHDMDVAFRVADRVTVMHNGRVLADGGRDEVKTDPRVAEIYLGSGVA
ncbi:MAG: ABC transporter ATP-binding protein [Deltaproteobacteria bacterium]